MSRRAPSRTTLAVANQAVDHNALEQWLGVLALRVVDGRYAALQRGAFRGGGQHGGTGALLQQMQSVGMIEMLMAGEQQLDRAGLEPEPRDVGEDRRHRLGGRVVDDDRTAVAGDQQHGDAAGSDVVDVAEDAHRRRGIAPAVLTRAGPVMLRDRGRTTRP